MRNDKGRVGYFGAALILTAFLLWWFFYPAPVRHPTEQPTEIEKRVIRAAQAKYGNFVIEREGGKRVMKTEYGEVKL